MLSPPPHVIAHHFRNETIPSCRRRQLAFWWRAFLPCPSFLTGQTSTGCHNHNGMSRVIHDHFFKQAKTHGYVARSAYKLLEIQQKYRIIPPGGAVLDLGCSPGAWLQVACQSIGPPSKGGAVVGIDLTPMRAPAKYCDQRVHVLNGDARDLSADILLEYAPKGYHAVLSDMCHYTHGNASIDAAKSLELGQIAWLLAVGAAAQADAVIQEGVLRPGGALVIKLLQGQGTHEFAQQLRNDFEKVTWHRPKATRSESKEVYLVGLKRKKVPLVVPSGSGSEDVQQVQV